MRTGVRRSGGGRSGCNASTTAVSFGDIITKHMAARRMCELAQNAVCHKTTCTLHNNFACNLCDILCKRKAGVLRVVFGKAKKFGQELAFTRSHDPLIIKQNVRENINVL